jgi:hypothetical protein
MSECGGQSPSVIVARALQHRSREATRGRRNSRECDGLDFQALSISAQDFIERRNTGRTCLNRAGKMERITGAQRSRSIQGHHRGAVKIRRSQWQQSQIVGHQATESLPRRTSLFVGHLAGSLLDAECAREFRDAPRRRNQIGPRSRVPTRDSSAAQLVREEGDENAGIDVDHQSIPSSSAKFLHHRGPNGHRVTHRIDLGGERCTTPVL